MGDSLSYLDNLLKYPNGPLGLYELPASYLNIYTPIMGE